MTETNTLEKKQSHQVEALQSRPGFPNLMGLLRSKKGQCKEQEAIQPTERLRLVLSGHLQLRVQEYPDCFKLEVLADKAGQYHLQGSYILPYRKPVVNALILLLQHIQ